ncbi:uncharacterized protein isoform X2 [Leptinotarsa decemlineata]|uniref:uncharacterized protein isoform X2 n=1 Tax=Leptinotarsa decemlineata TaxID=7539 RepID=UPI003D30C819
METDENDEYKISNMQRCPYIHEMKERLLGEQIPMEVIPTSKIPTPPPFEMDQKTFAKHQLVPTVVKLNPDGYGSHTSPAHREVVDRTPLITKDPEDDSQYTRQKVFPKNAKTSLFIVMSFVYAKLLVVICIAYVISDAVTHNIPLFYYEGFFTYLYGMSIFFLLYVFCFLLQESSCCSGGEKGAKPPSKSKKKEKEKEKMKEKEKGKVKAKDKEKKEEEKKKKEDEKQTKEKKEKEKDKKNKKQEKQEESEPPVPLQWQFEASTYRRNSEGVVDAGLAAVPVPVQEMSQTQAATVISQEQIPSVPVLQPQAVPPHSVSGANNAGGDIEAGTVSRVKCKRKTTQNDHSHGSFFLRIGAIAFGLGTMIYNGLEFGVFFEIPFTSPCYMILRGVNPVLQMVFTFMQMYFIFMNSRLNIHRFKIIARFGLMHVVATNICVWIRTLVIEYLKDITKYHVKNSNSSNITSESSFADSIKLHNLRNANTVLGTHRAVPDVIKSTVSNLMMTASTIKNSFQTSVKSAATSFSTIATTSRPTTSTPYIFTMPKNIQPVRNMEVTTPETTSTTAKYIKTTTANIWRAITTELTSPSTTTTTTAPTTTTTTATTTDNALRSFLDFRSFDSFGANDMASVGGGELSQEIGNAITSNETNMLDYIIPQALTALNGTVDESKSCGRVNIMGSIVEESGPYLYPFIIEYSLIGAAVIYIMWKHIGMNPRYSTQEDLEHRLELMLSRRAVALAHAQHGRVDCIGASKGLFFGLLMLVGSLICLILFFVLISNNSFRILAIYLAEVSHCGLMVLSIIAIIVGFIRIQSLKFKTEEQNELNDILLRISAFGLFIYAVFSVIAGHLNAFTEEANLLAMITGILAILQVVLQLLFIADVSRRRVYLPVHDRSKPGRQVVTFLLICNVTIWIIYTFEMRKVQENPVQLEFYGFLAWTMIQRFTLPLCIFHRFHSAVTLAEIWKTSYKARLE